MSLQSVRRRTSQPSSNLDAPNTALANYMDTLLSSIEAPVEKPKPKITKVELSATDIPEQQRLQPAPTLPTTSFQVRKDKADKGSIDRQRGPVVPTWAKGSFQILLFQVNEVMLAVPLAALGGILKWCERINELPGLPAWGLGILLDRERRILLVDTARLLMPERVNRLSRTIRSNGGYILLIEGTHWGLTVDGLATTLLLEPHQVRWRVSEDKRHWLAGVVIEQLSVLLDVEGLIGMLKPKIGSYSSDEIRMKHMNRTDEVKS